MDKHLSHRSTGARLKAVIAEAAECRRCPLYANAAVQKERGRVDTGPEGLPVFRTIHPSALLRIREADERAHEYGRFVADLRAARRWMKKAA